MNALGLSLLAHGLVLGFGVRAPVKESPRILEARLVAESPPPSPPEPAHLQATKPAGPAAEQRRPQRLQKHAEAPAPHSVPMPRPIMTRQAEPGAPVLVASAPSAAVSASPVASEPAAPATPVAANRVGGSAGPSGGGAVAYSPPGLGASYLHNPKPAYPVLARRRGLEGVVRLDVRVSAEGIPIAVKVRESSGHEALDEAALTAVWHWRFSPARRGGEAVEGAVVVPIRFNLEGDTAG